MANILTSVRIICALSILIVPISSKWFCLFYLLGGITDAVDGVAARNSGNATDFGAKFDTIADAFFVLAVIIRIICSAAAWLWLMIWICFTAIIKVVNIIIGFIKYHHFIAVHSVLNKICGIIVFIIPLFIGGEFAWQVKTTAFVFACTVASISAA